MIKKIMFILSNIIISIYPSSPKSDSKTESEFHSMEYQQHIETDGSKIIKRYTIKNITMNYNLTEVVTFNENEDIIPSGVQTHTDDIDSIALLLRTHLTIGKEVCMKHSPICPSKKIVYHTNASAFIEANKK